MKYLHIITHNKVLTDNLEIDCKLYVVYNSNKSFYGKNYKQEVSCAVIKGSEVVVKTLEKLKVDTIFGIPGIHNLDIYDALINSNIKHVTTRNESGAGFMADGYARSTGKPGVALVITGPGLTNIITPMGQAIHDSVPMVVISSQIPTAVIDQATGFLHELKNSTILAQSVAKESRIVTDVGLIERYIEDAYRLSMTGRPGPVHVEIPMDILREAVDESMLRGMSVEHLDTTVNQYFYEKSVEEAAALIEAAERIVLITGGGAVKAEGQVLQLAEKLNAPIVQTTAGKGVISEINPLCLGARLHFSEVREFIRNAHVVVAIGTQLSPTDLWEVSLDLTGKLIQIDIDAGAFNKNYPADIGVKGDAAQVLKMLLSKVCSRKDNGVCKKVEDIIVKTKMKLKEVTGISEGMDDALKMLKVIRKVIPEDGILCADMTIPAYIGISEFKAYNSRTFLHPVGFGTLGFALPAGIGAKLANPDKVVCVLEGDGGFQFTMQELMVAVENNISLPVIIWNNDGFEEIRRTEEARHSGQRIAVDHQNPDFMKLSEAYGIRGVKVTCMNELEAVLREAVKINAPSLIEVKVNGGRG
jgi:5-guanidino-2-oxopentanoate decarboxylase